MSALGVLRWRWLLLLGSLMAAAGVGEARHKGDYLNEVTTGLRTAHVNWAKPYAKGPLKVLFVVPRTVAPREVVELWQRFDVEYEAFTIAHSGLLSFESIPAAAHYDLAVEGTSIEEKTREILSKLNGHYDAFVFANASFDVLPKEAQYRILRQVADGAGLIFTFARYTKLPIFKRPTAEGRESIFSGVPLSGLDFLRQPDVLKALGVKDVSQLPAKLVETFRFKRGRIAVINWGAASSTYYGGHGLTPPEPYGLKWHANYEYYLSLVFKTLLWTVPSKQPRVLLTGLPDDGFGVARPALPKGLPVKLTCKRASGLDGKLLLVVRDRTGAEEFRREVPVSLEEGENALSVELPRLKAGGHFLDLILRSDAGTEVWGSVFFKVESPLAFSKFGPQREFYEKGQTARVSASLSAPAPEGTKVRVTLTDTSGRLYLIEEHPVPAGQRACSFECEMAGARTIASRLHGELVVGEEVVDAADRFLFVPRRASDEFRSILWGGLGCGTTGLGWTAYRQLRKAGFNAILSHPSETGAQERVFALCDLAPVVYSYRIMGGADAKGWRKDHWLRDIEDGCFYNPELQQKVRDVVLGRIAPVIPYGPILYTLGDENYYDYGSGYSPIGQKSFREYLGKQYGTLEALNAAWGTDYAKWADVVLLPDDEAKKRGLWPMVHEHMAFNETEYADYHHFLADAIRGADPHARVGAEGSRPGDLEKTIDGLDLWGPYAEKRGNELLRSLAPARLVRGNWWGGYVGSHGGRAGAFILWGQLFKGAVNTSLFFSAIGGEGMLRTELSQAGYFQDMLPELREIYGGIGQLIAASRVADDGIAVRWSQASEHSALLFGELGSPKHSQGNLLGLLDRCGYGYRYVTTKMIEDGELRKGGYRVLFLACSQAVSDGEAEEIRRFVEGAGTVIADVAPGIMDGHCKPLWRGAEGGAWSGQLDGLFGIARTGAPAQKRVEGGLSVRFGEDELSLSQFPFQMDASVGTAKQGALARVDAIPLFITNAVGRGRAVFLNFPFPNPQHPDGPKFMTALLRGVGLKQYCELLNGDGYFFRRFQNGALTLVGVLRQTQAAGDAVLKLAQPDYVYDVRAGKLLGKVASVKISRDGQRARLFSVLTSPTEKLTVDVGHKCRRGEIAGARLRISTGGVDARGRMVRVQLFGPRNVEALPYRSYVTLSGNQAELTVPLALSDAPGTWTLVATDVATGVSARASLVVE